MQRASVRNRRLATRARGRAGRRTYVNAAIIRKRPGLSSSARQMDAGTHPLACPGDGPGTGMGDGGAVENPTLEPDRSLTRKRPSATAAVASLALATFCPFGQQGADRHFFNSPTGTYSVVVRPVFRAQSGGQLEACGCRGAFSVEAQREIGIPQRNGTATNSRSGKSGGSPVACRQERGPLLPPVESPGGGPGGCSGDGPEGSTGGGPVESPGGGAPERPRDGPGNGAGRGSEEHPGGHPGGAPGGGPPGARVSALSPWFSKVLR